MLLLLALLPLPRACEKNAFGRRIFGFGTRLKSLIVGSCFGAGSLSMCIASGFRSEVPNVRDQ